MVKKLTRPRYKTAVVLLASLSAAGTSSWASFPLANALQVLRVPPTSLTASCSRARLPCSSFRHHRRVSTTINDNEDNDIESPSIASKHSDNNSNNKTATSKRQMLRFAGPALGIFLCNPLLSNIDNAFVGQTVGTQGLAALSPATICTDQVLYLFGFLGRATTGLVSRSYAATPGDNGTIRGNTDAARQAASAPLTVALACGAVCSLLYAVGTRPLLANVVRIDPSLQASAASYIYWRGAIAWAAMAQNVMLSVLLATRDATTPLKIVVLAALVNVAGDAALCVWPCRWGCAGAAAATAFATLVSSGCMVTALRHKQLLPRIQLPSRRACRELLEFTGPLLAITVTRLLGTIQMQRAAMRLGVPHMAAYQLSINVMFFFLLFGEPLSQLSQTQLPGLLVDRNAAANKGPMMIRATLQSILTLAGWTSLVVGGIAAVTLGVGSGLFTSDVAVQRLARQTAPALFAVVATGIFTIAVDGSMLASRDFGFMLLSGFSTLMIQWKFLASPTLCTSLSAIFATFTFRLGFYAVAALLRAALGFGRLGMAMRADQPTPAVQSNGAGGTAAAATNR